jgi:death-on-curing protein
MKYLRKNDITLINRLTIEDVGGNFVPPFNFLHEESLDYLIEAVEAEMFGNPLYPDIHHKTGLYMYNIIANHIFQDGNKRTGLEAALLFLQLNGFDLIIDDETLTNFTLTVASVSLV